MMDLFLALLNLMALKGVNQLQKPQSAPKLEQNFYNFPEAISFYLSTLHGDTRLNQMKMENFTLPHHKNPIKIIIHDWADSIRSAHILEMQEVMAGTNRWSVITINWAAIPLQSFGGTAGRGAEYEQRHIDFVAEHLALFTIELIRTNSISFKMVHYIGHGAGALIALQAASGIAARTNKRIARLTGLDPTFPSSRYVLPRELKEIAKFVDVIHTNGGGVGVLQPIGHIDFYPNGGKLQPDCEAERLAVRTRNYNDNSIVKDGNDDDKDEIAYRNVTVCSHRKACDYWTASVKRPHGFRAFNYKQWRDYINGDHENLIVYPMGILVNPTMPWGPYFLETQINN